MYLYVYKYLALALKPDNQIAISARSYYILPRDCERLPARTKKAFANVDDLYATLSSGTAKALCGLESHVQRLTCGQTYTLTPKRSFTQRTQMRIFKGISLKSARTMVPGTRAMEIFALRNP